MNETVCNCGKPTRDNAYVCDLCTTEFQQALAETPWLVDQLEISLTRQKGVDYTTKSFAKGGSKETPLAVDYGAFAAASQLRAALLTWTKFCHDMNVPNQSPTDSMPRLESGPMSRWLMWRIDGLAINTEGPAAMAAIINAVTHGKRVIDRPADKWFAGPCLTVVGDDQECGRDLYVTPSKPEVKCPACGTVYNVAAQRKWLYDSAQDHLAPADEIARAITVLSEEASATTVKTLRRLIADWHKAGRLPGRGHTMVRGKPSTLYRVGDVSGLVQVYLNGKEERA